MVHQELLRRGNDTQIHLDVAGLLAFGVALLGLWPRAGHEANALLLIMLTLQAAGQTAWHWRNLFLSPLFLGMSLLINLVLTCTFLLPESWVGVDHWGASLTALPGDWDVANIRPPILILLACLGLNLAVLSCGCAWASAPRYSWRRRLSY